MAVVVVSIEILKVLSDLSRICQSTSGALLWQTRCTGTCPCRMHRAFRVLKEQTLLGTYPQHENHEEKQKVPWISSFPPYPRMKKQPSWWGILWMFLVGFDRASAFLQLPFATQAGNLPKIEGSLSPMILLRAITWSGIELHLTEKRADLKEQWTASTFRIFSAGWPHGFYVVLCCFCLRLLDSNRPSSWSSTWKFTTSLLRFIAALHKTLSHSCSFVT